VWTVTSPVVILARSSARSNTQCQELADARAGDQRELQQGLELRHPLAGVEQSRLFIR
jgi:hypothetical protein